MQADLIFEHLWKDYIIQNPEVKRVYDSFKAVGENVINDHIAFRTFDHERIGIDKLARVFLAAGYVPKGEYYFEEKKLFARHYELPGKSDAPRVFISELQLDKCSQWLKETVTSLVNALPEGIEFTDDLIYKGSVFGLPSYEVYKKLREESEYAAWVYVYGFRANHFTVSVNHLKSMKKLEEVNEFLKVNGFKLNSSGGEIKGNPSELLEQSSTMAGHLEIQFIEGTFQIPSCYYEFALRYKMDNGELYSGFIAKSADKIFESTNFYTDK